VRAALGVGEPVLLCLWKTIARIERGRRPTWELATCLGQGPRPGDRPNRDLPHDDASLQE
jgi:hypothetical protein